MENGFVDYLKSMNNATSGNINALAESQVTNKFYNSIRVTRKLGTNISNQIKSANNVVYILTGHAGDGKTSILIQVLKELGMLGDGEKLKVDDEINKDGISLYYVKDMSELAQERQIDLLKRALEAPTNNKSAILISNTGPLLNSFQRLLGSSDEIKDKIENTLLEQLDTNENKKISLLGYDFYLVNIARIDNTGFVKEIINKICKEENWTGCRQCENKERCPVFSNYTSISENKNTVIDFVESYYRWLYENDKRITIRQMLSQISFAITGNVKCDDLKKWDKRVFTKFQYSFANLFFGYKGINMLSNAKQIKAIDYLQQLELDSIALKSDYEMFVKNNFSILPNGIQETVVRVWKEFSKRYHNEEDSKINLENDLEMRRAIRRFYLVYGLKTDLSQDRFSEILGDTFVEYKRLISEKQSPRSLRSMKKVIFDALYIKNIGIPPKNENKLYLTLTRYDGAFQSVLLLLGKANYDEIEVVQIEKDMSNEDISKKFDLYLSIKNGVERFKLNLPILMYFKSVVDGAISTDMNPALSHGLAELNSKLLKVFRYSDKNTIKMIVNTLAGTQDVEAQFEEDKVYII
ncbi:hypothetical protein JK636_07335 [Clostridium sp. YIM B02515]|uniref:DNA phosphorothioation-dependent restriction protein DptF n=1 Tax=Clostridium rhizosphaerae TaxID=2803861 RepID=A0ABS1TA80_9CLOT|nr:hypothetical protein [Clostridium rhizosphaerae]MBL4935571.1 hypothetical protein [Clostridium rhizosphaerae]